MRNLLYYFLSFALVATISCNSKSGKQEKSNAESSSVKSKSESGQIVNESGKKEDSITQEQILIKYNHIIKKLLRDHLQEKFLSNYKTSIVKHESLALNKDAFTYTIVLIDPLLYKETTEFGNSDKKSFSITELGDTLSINGKFELSNPKNGNIIQMNLKSEVNWYKLTQSPYQGYYRYNNSDYVESTYQFDGNQKLQYEKADMYLKARFFDLKRSDLKTFSKEELSYLRNEIFARHGYIFKSDKMKSYFSTKDWYLPCFNDVTPFLNETEKSNALFIKELENEYNQ